MPQSATKAGRLAAPIRVTVLGAGEIGRAIAVMLSETADYAVTLVDQDSCRLERLPRAIAVRHADASTVQACAALLADADAVLNALPFHSALPVATAAVQSGVHYFDCAQDVRNARAIRELASDARSVLMPQCGLAPGFINIVGHDLARAFLGDEGQLIDLRLRVGALPRFPDNALQYNLTWNAEGLINLYCNPCEAIVDGQRTSVAALEGLEQFSLDGIQYEAFHTSGGLGTLTDTLEGRARNVDFKAIRYPGHGAMMKLLLNDLRLRERRDCLLEMLENAIPATQQDVVIVFASASGRLAACDPACSGGPGSALTQNAFSARILGAERNATRLNAIQLTTAAGICTALDLVANGVLPQAGFIRQEDTPLNAFLDNRFGQCFAAGAVR